MGIVMVEPFDYENLDLLEVKLVLRRTERRMAFYNTFITRSRFDLLFRFASGGRFDLT